MPKFVNPTASAISLALLDRRKTTERTTQKEGFIVSKHYEAFIQHLVNDTPPLFRPVPLPQPDDWLANHDEEGQTFMSFVNTSFKIEPSKEVNTILLVLIGEPPHRSIVEALQHYIAAFYQLHVRVIAPVPLDTLRITTRINMYTNNRQLLTKDCLRYLTDSFMKCREYRQHIIAAVGLTMEDLYPRPEWNFVFGQASLKEGVGIFSLARFLPSFEGRRIADPEEERRIIVLRGCRTLTHEIGHIFGLKHCIYFHCLMNGSNSLPEADAGPRMECPVCLKKLTNSFAWDIMKRYDDIRIAMHSAGFSEADELVAKIALIASRDLQSSPPACIGNKYQL